MHPYWSKSAAGPTLSGTLHSLDSETAISLARPSIRCSRRRCEEVKGTSSSREAGVAPFPAGRRERQSRCHAVERELAMTRQKSFKELIRARMDKTGESYATARR
jgi:hypothetical protein